MDNADSPVKSCGKAPKVTAPPKPGTLQCRSVRVYALYQVRDEFIPPPYSGTGQGFWMKQAYTPKGEYIGSPRDAHRLCVKRGIIPEVVNPDPNHPMKACSVGWSPLKRKWFGWSHRAIYGFRIGSKVKKGDCGYTPKNLGGRGAWTAKTLADARQMAIDFAEGVG